MNRRRIRNYLLVFLLACLALPAGIYPAELPALAGSENPTELAVYSAVSLQAKGRLAPEQWVNLSFPNAGSIAEIRVPEGAVVTQGTQLAAQGEARRFAARVAAAELELLLSQQAYSDLKQNANLELALAELRLAEAIKVQEMAAWKARTIGQPASSLSIAQAHANMLLAEKSLEKARKELHDGEKLWNDRRDMMWRFVPRRVFKLNLAVLRQKVAQAENRYTEAVDKWEDLQKLADEIDVQMAQAELQAADADVQDALRQRDAWSAGPDPDEVALAQARIHAAQQSLNSAQADWGKAQISAPFSGVVVSIPAKAGEWVEAQQPVLVIADLSSWQVEVDDLGEGDIPGIWIGQPVEVTFDALPDIQLRAIVRSIDLMYIDKDGAPTFSVDLTLLESDPRLRWGMTARLEFMEMR